MHKIYLVSYGKDSLELYRRWEDCQVAIEDMPNVKYHSFDNLKDARLWVKEKCPEVREEYIEYLLNTIKSTSRITLNEKYGEGIITVKDEIKIILKGNNKILLKERRELEDTTIHSYLLAVLRLLNMAKNENVTNLYIYHNEPLLEDIITGKVSTNKSLSKLKESIRFHIMNFKIVFICR